MSPAQEDFIDLIEEIVHAEMEDHHKDQFEIEGRDIIAQHFFSDNNDSVAAKEKHPDTYGLSPQTLEIFNGLTGFGALVIACISLANDLKSKQRLRKEREELKFLEELRLELIKQHMPEEMINNITTKYSEKLAAVLKKL